MNEWINYNQFYYFWVIAQEMSVTQASRKLRLSQSNLSEQLRDFEDLIGQRLFERKGRKIHLTEAGKIALEYANTIFPAGREMLDFFRNRPAPTAKAVLRIGAISSLSKNLQFQFIKPVLDDSRVKLVMIEGSPQEIVRQLQNHQLDVVISNFPLRSDRTPELFNHSLAQIRVALVGTRNFLNLRKDFPRSLAEVPIFLPSKTGRFRSEFESWLERKKIAPNIKAEIEDMALLRLFALSGKALALVPEIVVQRELAAGELHRVHSWKQLSESFYAVTTTRKFPNPTIEALVRHFEPSDTFA